MSNQLNQPNPVNPLEQELTELGTPEEREKRLQGFLMGLTQLTQHFGIYVWGCGHCGSPTLEEEVSRLIDGGGYTQNFEDGHLEYLDKEEYEAYQWCQAKGVQYIDLEIRDVNQHNLDLNGRAFTSKAEWIGVRLEYTNQVWGGRIFHLDNWMPKSTLEQAVDSGQRRPGSRL